MVNQMTVRLGYLKRTDITGRFEGVVENSVQFSLLRNHVHESCRGDVFIPAGSVVSVSELYRGAAYLLERCGQGTRSRREDVMFGKLWPLDGENDRFYETTHICLWGSFGAPVGTGFNLYRNRTDFSLSVSRRPGR